MLNSIPIDIIEKIVVFTKSYRTYEYLSEIIVKLKDPFRRSRIVESLTIKRENSKYIACYLLEGEFHRENDESAIVERDGTKEWFRFGKYFRDNDKPVIEAHNGIKEWRTQRGALHRENDMPAMITPTEQRWYRNGKLHRDGDKPARVYKNGDKYWYRLDYLHRDNGKPAVMLANGQCWWWVNGSRLEQPEHQYGTRSKSKKSRVK